MFSPVRMSKTNIFVLNSDLEKVSSILYDLKLIEFFDISPEKYEKYEHVDSNILSSDLLKLRSIITILKPFFTKSIKDLTYNNLSKIDDILVLKEKYDKLKKEKLHLLDEQNREKVLHFLKLKKNDLDDDKRVIGFVKSDDVSFFKNLKKNKISFKKHNLNGRSYFTYKSSKKINLPFKEFYLPKDFEKGIKIKLDKVNSELNKINLDLKLIANSSLNFFQVEELKLTKELSSLEVKNKFAKTKNISVLSGFIPSNKIKIINRKLEENLGNKFTIEFEDVKDEAPVQLSNPTGFKNFEDLLKMYSLPKYNEFDPTALLALIFPIFFGFILGDVIYGLIALIFFTIAKVKMKPIKNFLSILQISAISSIFFGFIYGEFLGFEPHSILGFESGTFFGFFHRTESPQTLLVIAVIFGLIHINLGLIIGFINNLKNMKKAVCDNASWIILQFGVGLISLGVYKVNEVAISVGVIFTILSLVLIYLAHGFIGIMEVPSFFTNILSYARLMAVGLSSIAIAVLINDYSKILFAGGIGGIIAGVLLFSIGHIFNIILGCFEGFIHTMRLHYVEFFTKFYTGGGREFIPFGKKLHQFEK